MLTGGAKELLRTLNTKAVSLHAILRSMPHGGMENTAYLLERALETREPLSEHDFELRECLACYIDAALRGEYPIDATSVFAATLLIPSALASENDTGYAGAWRLLIRAAYTTQEATLTASVRRFAGESCANAQDEWHIPPLVALRLLDLRAAAGELSTLPDELDRLARRLSIGNWRSACVESDPHGEWRGLIGTVSDSSAQTLASAFARLQE